MKCSKCGIELSGEDMIEHNLVCSYTFNDKDYENLIPCEICNELISFDDYQSHIEVCSRPTPNMIPLPLPPNFDLRNFPILSFMNEGGDLAHEENLANPENIENSINQINNDPIARSLFSMFVGNLSNITPQTNNEDDDAMSVDEEDEDNSVNNDEPNIPVPSEQIFNMFESLLGTLPQPPAQTNDYENLLNLEDHTVGVSNIDDVSQFLFEEISCPICSQTKMVSRKTSCNHKFCDECLQEWLKESKKCPICMIDLE